MEDIVMTIMPVAQILDTQNQFILHLDKDLCITQITQASFQAAENNPFLHKLQTVAHSQAPCFHTPSQGFLHVTNQIQESLICLSIALPHFPHCQQDRISTNSRWNPRKDRLSQ